MNTADTYARCLLIIAAFSNRLNDYKITPSIAIAGVYAPRHLRSPPGKQVEPCPRLNGA
jgi:hypothetical protein